MNVIKSIFLKKKTYAPGSNAIFVEPLSKKQSEKSGSRASSRRSGGSRSSQQRSGGSQSSSLRQSPSLKPIQPPALELNIEPESEIGSVGHLPWTQSQDDSSMYLLKTPKGSTDNIDDFTPSPDRLEDPASGRSSINLDLPTSSREYHKRFEDHIEYKLQQTYISQLENQVLDLQKQIESREQEKQDLRAKIKDQNQTISKQRKIVRKRNQEVGYIKEMLLDSEQYPVFITLSPPTIFDEEEPPSNKKRKRKKSLRHADRMDSKKSRDAAGKKARKGILDLLIVPDPLANMKSSKSAGSSSSKSTGSSGR